MKVAAPVYLDWSDKPITFDRADHPDHVSSPGKYPLVVDPIIGDVRLTKVLMDGGSSLNIIYAESIHNRGSGSPDIIYLLGNTDIFPNCFLVICLNQMWF